MNYSPWNPLSIFLTIMLLLTGVFLWTIFVLLSVYSDAHVRKTVRTALVEITDRQGWLLSDIAVTDVGGDSVKFIHREHRRGADPEACFVMALSDLSLRPCR